MSDLHEDRKVSDFLSGGFRRLKRKASTLFDRPEGADDVMLQLRRMLPAEGWLTERMARLRTKAHLIRRGHVARIEELRGQMTKLPTDAKRQASQELMARYREASIDLRLERLDKSVAQNERRVRDLTRQAQAGLQSHDYLKVTDLLEAASKLQAHNARLLKAIERTETKLGRIAQSLATKPTGATAK